MAKTALVTGGAGFIGSHVADRFLRAGYDVTILDDLSSGRRDNLPEGVRFVLGDITSPEAADLVRDGRFDVLCHLAAQIDVRRSVEDPAWDARQNIIGTLNLMEAVRTSGHRTRVIFSSTGGALFGAFDPPPSAETFSKDPEAPYGIAKLAAEYYLAYYGRVHGVDTVALRYGNVYGPR
jgi:UDP-glucose 4-epimerase